MNASSFMIKTYRFGTKTYTAFFSLLIKRLLKWLSMENGTLNTYLNSSVSLSEVPQKSITVITKPSFSDYNYQTNSRVSYRCLLLLPGNLFKKYFPFSSFNLSLSPYILPVKLKRSIKHSTFHCLFLSVKILLKHVN